MTGRVLIIDDEEQLRKLLTRIISLEGFTVIEAGSLKAAAKSLMQQPVDVVLCDVRLPDGNGVDFVKMLKKEHPSLEVILLTAFGNISDGVQAMKNGAFDYIVKGDDNDRIIPLLNQAMEKSGLQKKLAVTIKEKGTHGFDEIIGHSRAIRDAISLAKVSAPTDTNVLLLGETGTGKEIFANAIHSNSKRSGRSFIAINCSAFTKELLEGELFGHKAGAYTGATRDKKGLIEIAHEGTLFLDEIGDMPLELQVKLLRFIENGEFIKLGDTRISKVNVRLIAATNCDLKNSISEGGFREDLYYRLSVFTIQLPSLRTRPEDIAELADHFLSQFGGKARKIAESSLQLLKQHSWKGNIRELKNVIERAAILADGSEILPEHLPFEIQQQNAANPHELSLAAIEKQHIQKILQYTGGNKAKAARLLEIGLATLYRKMEEYNIVSALSK